jgi:cytidylate kinase
MVAERLGFLHLDTGAMYRAVTLKVLRSAIAPASESEIEALLRSTSVSFGNNALIPEVLLDGEDVSSAIREAAVTANVSAVSALRQVRIAMVAAQRAIGRGRDLVAEGRDIGTVVFPDAALKVFMIADIESRARRRHEELRAKGIASAMDELREAIRRRDELDSSREESPLTKASDAIELDTSSMTIEEQVGRVVALARERMERVERG